MRFNTNVAIINGPESVKWSIDIKNVSNDFFQAFNAKRLTLEFGGKLGHLFPLFFLGLKLVVSLLS